MNNEDAILWAAMMQRLGGWCAIAGAGFLVAGGIGFAGVSWGREPEAVLQQLSTYPIWYWPAVNIAFVAGACLWIIAFMGLNTSWRDVRAGILGQVGTVSLLLGAGVYAVSSFVSGTALTALAQQWVAAPLALRSDIVRSTDALLMLLDGTWIGVVILFYGVPFVLMGMALARDARAPRALRWIAVMGGLGSMLTGALMLTAVTDVPATLSLLFAAVGALWMVGVGIILRRPSVPERRTHEALQVA